jgi:Tfp pilus assembly protein PilN
VSNRFNQTSLGQQLAILTAGLCLLVSLALVALGAISTRHMQMLLQEEYGTSLARLVAARISTAMERGDLLSVSATLQRLRETSTAQAITIIDVDGKTLGQAGEARGQNLYQYSAPVHIEANIAGQIVITINADNAQAAQSQFVLSMLGLSILLSLAVYAGSRRFGQRLGGNLASMARKIALEEDNLGHQPANELLQLSRRPTYGPAAHPQ